MPFVGICKNCNWTVLGEKLREVVSQLHLHMMMNHKKDDYFSNWMKYNVNFEDFVRYETELESPYDLFRTYTFSSKIYYTYDYCIAVITHSDFNSHKNASTETLYKYFKEYFPPHALDKNRTMVKIKEFEDVSKLSDRELKELSKFVSKELEKRGLR